MIFVGGLPLDNQSQDSERLAVLMEHPFLVSSSLLFKNTAEIEFSKSGAACFPGSQGRHVYIFQREYATVDPSLVDWIGTDEATTCVGIVIRNKENGMTSIAHMDSPDVVEVGLSQMLAEVAANTSSSDFDVHLVGGYDDTSPEQANSFTQCNSQAKLGGFSLPLCMKIVEALGSRRESFHIQTLFILGHNTRKESEGMTYPVFNGFMVETFTGRIMPARFNETTRCPDEIVRRIRVSESCWDASCSGKLRKTYDSRTDQFIIPPFRWNKQSIDTGLALQQLSDREILLTCSTSPAAEAPDFVENMRRGWDYLIRHPDWKDTFRLRKPRVFKRSPGSGSWGGWVMVSSVLDTK